MLINKIKRLEVLQDKDRFQFILDWLKKMQINSFQQKYGTGTNIIVPSTKKRFIGVASHFDTVYQTPGANDNCSAIVVCMALLKKLKESPLSNIGLQVFFFDEEEVGLVGSRAYVKKYDIKNMIGLINLEMLGQGNSLALWPLNTLNRGKTLQTFEHVATEKEISIDRFDRIVMNTADHQSFREAGLKDAFTVTCISEKDKEVAYHYYKALAFDVSPETLYQIIQKAPLFEHYHQPTDLSKNLSEQSLNMAVEVIWDTINLMDETYHVPH